MKFVDVGDAENWQHDEHQRVAKDKVGSEQAELGDLANVFSTWLRHRMPSHRVPFTSPPGDVGGVLLELASQRQRNDQLEDKSLQGNHGNHAQQGACEDPSFQEEHHFEEGEQHDDGSAMSDGSQD